jgi:uncharacterized protein YggE
MRLILAAAAALAAHPAAAQPASAAPAYVAPRAYDPAPWWMDKPVIPSVGQVTTEISANRAAMAATYDAVEHEVADATKGAIQKARTITSVLEAFGPDKVRVQTNVAITPLYEQYRDKQGNRVDNERADKIERYQASVTLRVEIRDVRLVERVYSILVSAKPSSTQAPTFTLDPSDEVRAYLYKAAIEDARRRAETAATAAGAKLGAVRVIDPTTRACQTDVLLALAPRSYDTGPSRPVPAPLAARQSSIEELVVSSQKRAQAAGLKPEDLQLPIQPPLEKLEARACVVYSLG